MASSDGALRLRLWSLATFRLVSFVVLVVAFVYRTGSLGDRLAPVGTTVGLAAFAVLWTTTFVATRWGLRRLNAPIEDVPPGAFVAATVPAAGGNGLAVFAPFLFGFVGIVLARTGAALSSLLAIFLTAVIGSIVASMIGAMVGLVFASVESLLLRIGALLFRRAGLP